MSDVMTIVLTELGRKIERTIDKLGESEMSIGYDDSELAKIAACLEYGTSKMPARPFLSNTMKNRKQEIRKGLQEAMMGLQAGASDEDILSKFGEAIVRAVQAEIQDGDYAPLADSTIRRKGSDIPLIETGRLLREISYRKGKK